MCDSRLPDKEEETALRDGAWHTAQLAVSPTNQKTKENRGWGWLDSSAG